VCLVWGTDDRTRFAGGVGPGPGLVKKAVDLRLPHIDADERAALQAYLYHISVRRGSGEYALNTVLSMGAWARRPLGLRMPGLRMPALFLCKSIRTGERE
jgi:hypothetical protein